MMSSTEKKRSDDDDSSIQNENERKPFIPHPNLTGVFAGSGSDGMNEQQIADTILNLVNVKTTTCSDDGIIHVLYLGTATYDLDGPRQRQISQFVNNTDYKCQIHSIDIVNKEYYDDNIEQEQLEELFLHKANIIIVSGGNTLYAIDRWKLFGIDKLLQKAMEKGVVLTGGSAGAIVWFQGGHSDSADPETYKSAMLKEKDKDTGGDESSTLNKDDIKEWNYIRIPALEFIPGLICPHHDRIQSNGKLRANDFDEMLLRCQNPTELGIGIDHWAALSIYPSSKEEKSGDIEYEVISIQNKPGSVLLSPSSSSSTTTTTTTANKSAKDDDNNGNASFVTDGSGIPGIWLKHVDSTTGKVVRRLLPQKGKLTDILPYWSKSTRNPDDQRVEECRKANPSS